MLVVVFVVVVVIPGASQSVLVVVVVVVVPGASSAVFSFRVASHSFSFIRLSTQSGFLSIW